MNNRCRPSCRLCNNLVISQSISILTINGVNTLVIDLPAGSYGDGCKKCIIIAQTIPATATINMPVAFSIGGVTTTVYPLVRCNCVQATACSIRTRTRYSTRVETTATGGVFKSLGGLSCCPSNNLASLPAPTTAPAVATTTDVEATPSAVFVASPTSEAKTTKTTSKKEVVDNA